MKKVLKPNGNSWLLYISKMFIKILGINDENRKVLISVEDSAIFVRVINKEEQEIYKNDFVKNLIKRGSGYGLIFTNDMMNVLKVNPETDSLNIDIKGKVLKITKNLSD